MRFPERELEIVQLGQDMAEGLTANAELFPTPPAAAEAITEAITAYTTARASSIAADASAKQGRVAKNEALASLTGMLRANINYARGITRGDPGRLRLVGYGGRRKPVKNEKIVPGSVVPLEVREEGSDWVTLAWQEPLDGGTVAAYSIQRRRREGGDWTVVGNTTETTHKLDRQETGVELEYRIIAFNAAGEGPVSNAVRVVL